jgi:hypothetical protein
VTTEEMSIPYDLLQDGFYCELSFSDIFLNIDSDILNVMGTKDIDSLYNTYKNITNNISRQESLEFITKYVQNQYLIIDNLPMDVLGDDYVSVQVQPQTQVQEPQVQEPQSDAQNSQAQQTAQEIPAQTQPQPQPQTPPQTQSQTQPQNTQNTQEI